jgi:FkbH-like protein
VKLATALQILAGTSKGLPSRNVFLVCGFSPLHLQTFLTAHLQCAHAESRVTVATGLYGDLLGNVARIPPGAPAAVVIEWPDLDPRLGFRNLGGWSWNSIEDILSSVRSRLKSLAEQLRNASRSSTLTIVLPGTPLAPVSFTPPWMADRLSLGVRRFLAEFAEGIMEPDRMRILNSDDLARFEGEPFQLKSELENGFPYSLGYADFLAQRIALSLDGPQPKKGLITDLDDTLWAGILGEDGIEGIRWTLEGHSQVHGLYQQVLASLAECGVLVAVASKNDSRIVEEAFARLPLAVKADQLFPRVANWERKSRSVKAILKAWNIGPQDVVFVDDSAAELEEVKTAFPEITCIQFKATDAPYSHTLLLELRSLFGKVRLGEEDAIRASTIRNAEKLWDATENSASENELLAGLRAIITMTTVKKFDAGRALDLINKTNQFNMNGRRYELMDWIALESQPERSLLVVEYLDKFGSLGKISVLSGFRSGSTFKVDTWVMSCRAFARRIEYAILDFLLRKFDLRTIELAYERTSRNGPFGDFLQQICGTIEPSLVKIERSGFVERCPPLFQEIKECH